MPRCPQCRRTFDDRTGYCPYDGTRVVDEGAPDAPPPAVIDGRRPRENEYDRLIGQTLESRYLIESRLGEGGMGVVFRARHVVIEKSVAVKVLKREVARDPSVVRRFVQEARAASRIGHPNIIDVTDFGVTPDGMTYQVMEHLEGETLSALLKRERRLPLPRALPIVAQLARALGAAHDKGIVHRDLKPENIFLLSRDGRPDFVKVVDFGIAKVQPVDGAPDVPRLTRAGSVFGTPEYMALEQAQGKSDADQRVDIYALGTIFYEMLVGRVPHRGETPMRTLAMQLLEPIVPPRQALPGLPISDGVEAVLMTALAKDRELRYRTMGDLLAALVGVVGDVGLEQPASRSGPVAHSDASTVPEVLPVVGDDGSTLPMAAPAPHAAAPLVEPADAPVPAARRRVRVIAAVAVLAAVGVAGAAWLAGADRAERRETAALSPGRPAPVEGTPADAAPSRAVEDAAPAPLDAASTVAVADAPPPDPTPPRVRSPDPPRPPALTDAGPATVPGSGPDVEVQVVTDPRGGRLIHNGIDGGPDGTNFRRPQGTVLTVQCRQYDRSNRLVGRGTVRVSFDGDDHLVVCHMRPVRKPRCVEGLKNPLDDCPD